MFGGSSGESDDDQQQGNNDRLSSLAKIRADDMRENFSEEIDHFRKRGAAEARLSDSDSDGDAPPPPKKKMNVAESLMAKMGYNKGEGLGKAKQGRVEPVGLSTQRGRVGLGHESTKVIGRDLSAMWDESKEDKTVNETVKWLEIDDGDRTHMMSQLDTDWIEMARKKMIIDDEAEYCSQEILTEMLEAKKVFDNLSDRELREARTRANPYETIGAAFFQNRAAMKTANLDKVFDWIFSQEKPTSLTKKNPMDVERGVSVNVDRAERLFYFADVCAGPGGFSEYMLWRKGFYNAKGFGFTLKGENDFKLGKFTACSPHYFEPYYGVTNDGDVTVPENIDAFEKFVLQGTDGRGVDMMMADGGFSVEGQENIQEILSKRIYLCQLLVSLCILREGGSFFCKLFDVFTPFSAGLVHLMRLSFKRISLHKPHTSRPANSERYIICDGLRKEFSDKVRDYLKTVNKKLDVLAKAKSEDDVRGVVPAQVMRDDEPFFRYLVENNEWLAQRQTTYLQKYLSFAKNAGQIDRDQGKLREECMQFWMIPNKPRPRLGNRMREQGGPHDMFGRYSRRLRVPAFDACLLQADPRHEKHLRHLEWACVRLTERQQPRLLVSTGDQVFVMRGRWEQLASRTVRIPDKTILLVEVTNEYSLEGRTVKKGVSEGVIRVIDAAVLNGDNVSMLPYAERMSAAAKFVQAISLVVNEVTIGPPRQQRSVAPVKLVCAERYEVRHFAEIRSSIRSALHQGDELLLFDEGGCTFACRGVRGCKVLADAWQMCWSASNRLRYAAPKMPRPGIGSTFEKDWSKFECGMSFWESAVMKKDAPITQWIWNWQNKMDNSGYGLKAILELDEHPAGPTINSVLELVRQINERMRVEM